MPGVYLPVELKDLSFELAEQSAQGFETRTGDIRDAIIFWIGDSIEQFLHAVAADGSDNTELGQVRADRIDDCGLLPDKEMPRAVKHEATLLVACLSWYEAHARPLYCLADDLGIDRVVLLALNVRLHVGRRYETHGMSESLQFARPVMRGGARLDTDEARRQLLEEREHITTLQLPTNDGTAPRVHAMNLKDRLCNVEADCRYCQHDEFLRIVVASSATDSKALARPVGGAVHSIKS